MQERGGRLLTPELEVWQEELSRMWLSSGGR